MPNIASTKILLEKVSQNKKILGPSIFLFI